jgi:diaminohydroxyphosphoribosylaminopyrimidine deaminase/5-amino-6-(5-phosphoribosylamino)uracil reductase
MEQKEEYMRLALELAKKGKGRTNPNPMVGAVVVKDGSIIGQGYHEQYGQPHAERNALQHCEKDPAGGEMYVTLEPCHHYGKTPPCTEIILQKGIKKVYVGSLDPNPLVSGKGLEFLKSHGITVETGMLKEECDAINEVFFHYISTGIPYVVMKYAMTADGKIATVTGESRWITGEQARHKVHETRRECMAIMVGIGTVLADNPMLNCRIPQGKNPIRIICDSHLRIPLDSDIVKTAREIPTIVATAWENSQKQKALQSLGVEVLQIPNPSGKVDLSALMVELGKRNIDSLLLEGGGELNFAALQAGIVQELQVYVAPKIFGGAGAKFPVAGEGIADIQQAFLLQLKEVTPIGEDVFLRYHVAKRRG